MNSHIKGIIYDKLPGMLTIDNNGMGFSIHISMNTFNDLPDIDNEILIYTHISIKNEEIKIFGFSTLKEKSLFNQLIQIPKIGPKTAISVFNTLTPEQFEEAVYSTNTKRISTVKGISQKTADRIVLELSGKIEFAKISVTSDAYDALIVLGFKPRNIEKAINLVSKEKGDNLSTEEIIREALMRLR
ncbi:Holliday junction branch migration protein RuvA [candidate division WOR-3 bacterium]|nr:Holliday junction branch migration protein RuvA [candidate division WOR-3 bacterium]